MKREFIVLTKKIWKQRESLKKRRIFTDAFRTMPYRGNARSLLQHRRKTTHPSFIRNSVEDGFPPSRE
jgi:hypothetical protein